MKKLLVILSAFTLIVSPSLTVTSCINSNNQRDDDFSGEYSVPSEIQLNYLQLRRVAYENLKEYDDVNVLEHLLNKSIIMFNDIYDSEFFYKYMDTLNVVISKYSNELSVNGTLENYKNEINNLTSSEEPRFSSDSFNNALKQYQFYKHWEYLKFLQTYHVKDDDIGNKLTAAYYQRTKVTEYLKEFAAYATSDQMIAKNLMDMSRIFEDASGKLTTAKKLFDVREETYTDYRDSTEWFSDHWALSFVPFYGPVFFTQFAHHLEHFVNALKDTIDLFTPGDDGKTYLDKLDESLKEDNANIEISADSMKDIANISDELNYATNTGPLIATITGIVIGMGVAFAVGGPIGGAVAAIVGYVLAWIMAIAASYDLSNSFVDIKDKYDTDIISSYDNIESTLESAKSDSDKTAALLASKAGIYDKLLNFTNRTIAYYQERMEYLNNEISTLETEQIKLHNEFELKLSKCMQSGYEYFMLLDDMSEEEQTEKIIHVDENESSDFDDLTLEQIRDLKIEALDNVTKLYNDLNIGVDDASINFYNDLVDNDKIINDTLYE